MRRWTMRLGFGAGILLMCATGLGFLILRASLPQTTGNLALPGLERPVRVIRDAHGVPSIVAANRHDLYMALGFVHAQDRLFQMDMQRRLGAGRNPAWCGDAGCARLTADALKDALDDIATRYGATMERWRWGEAHRASFEHPVFSRIPILGNLFGRHPPAGGASDTINAGGFDSSKDETPFADLNGPGLRAVYDLADPDNSTFQIALGQSAHVLSLHYDDMQTLWLRFEGIRIVREPQDKTLKDETLTLLP